MDQDFGFKQVVGDLRSVFESGKTKRLKWRLEQLQRVIDFLTNHEDELVDALNADLRKPRTESLIMEIRFTKNEAIYHYNNLSSWLKPQSASKLLVDMAADCYVRRDPYGVTLIIGTWNYPVQLTLCPLIGAIAGGNCCILKLSEIANHTSKLIEKLITDYLDKDCIRVVTGEVPETTALLKEKFDMIFFTGSQGVGKIVLRAGAEHLTPVVLELGGKAPVYIDKNCNLTAVAQRITWGKFTNSGQTCLAPDYALCHPDIQDELISALRKAITTFYGPDPQQTTDYGRLISEKQFDRVSKLVDSDLLVIGGQMDKTDLYIAPTVLRDVSLSHPIMQEEIFGPILPILPVETLDDAIKVMKHNENPLALYVFSNNKHLINRILDTVPSGGVGVNDTAVHAAPNSLPFGGKGQSGMGCYHGVHSFNAFTVPRSVLHKDLRMESLNGIRYPPSSERKLGLVSWVLQRKQKSPYYTSVLTLCLVLGTLMALAIKSMSMMR